MAARRGALVKLAVFALAISVVMLAATSASAQDELISIDSITITPGGGTTLEVNALNMPAPGLGAWSIGVEHDPSILSALSCSPVPGSVCNVDFSARQVRIVGASASGLTGDSVLASITFNCNRAGVSDLVIDVSEFADATVGGPQPIVFMVQNGRISCSASSPVPPGPPLRGDADCNGRVDSRDALLVLQFEAALLDSLPCPDLADVNDDGSINSVDAGLIKQIDAGLV